MSAIDPKKKTALQALTLVVVMGALAWASVPFYDWFCRVTGFGGVTNTAEAGSDVVLDRTIKVRFDASLERDMPWEFKPMQRQMEIKIGETGLAFYEAYNPHDRPIAGSASYNVTPYERVHFSRKLTVSALKSRFCNPANVCKCL
jgi:cytochrome c oxidase assembly protein subunit 11